MSSPVILSRPDQATHFRAIALLHIDSITSGFLSILGASFLTALYQAINEAPNSGIFIAREGEKVLGYISYTQDVKACYREVLRRHGFRLMIRLLPSFFHPSRCRKMFETLTYPMRQSRSQQSERAEASATLHKQRSELLSMAVSAQARGKGVGKLLVAALDQELRNNDAPGYFVVTHGTDERSNGFYQSCGFTPQRVFQSHGKPMREYYKSFRI